MVTTDEEITRRLQETDSARSTRRAQAATTVGELARRHAELADQLGEIERQVGAALTAAADVIDVPELAQVTDVPADDLTRWRDQAVKPTRGSRRKRPNEKKNGIGRTDTDAGAEPRPAAPSAVSGAVGTAGTAVGAASS
ncbi:hypothetical protein [Amycolatopsis vastitatis]|uniref:hypothetical protein n=1 Tax=Amycolatopsis vastitatis TaxID=1905142 RepID=UPI00196AD2AF|nr:hypothetical protein [Amycolatopsis vastitatis]